MKQNLVNMQNENVGEIELADGIFARELNQALLYQAVKRHLANKRMGTAATKTRGLVRGGGRKPWRQKGTGRARSGSTRSPIWVGGGTVFGPQPRSYKQKMPRRMRRLATAIALSEKLRAGELVFLNEFKFEAPKTKEGVKFLQNFDTDRGVIVTGGGLEYFNEQDELVIIPEEAGLNEERTFSNIQKAAVITEYDLNAYDILNAKKIFMTKRAVEQLTDLYAELQEEAI